ncbi:Double-strand break repair protein MRE11 [Galdieria sulphuraria]|nr:Double-strand break repair protein MRE11 [Galdieria sulphuraria]
MSSLEETDADFVPENILKILVATDIHLGYCERHPIRGDDSFHTFEEILSLARRHEVDMVLLGGDLFHENKPSRSCLVRTMRILRDYCLGEKPVAFDFLSVATEVLDSPYSVNFMDPYHSVSLPIFTIHGNHDDPVGGSGEQFSALDILQLANLINYFGKVKDAQSIQLLPLLIQKGVTKLALYGLGNIRDERLYATWHDEGKVTWLRPQVSDLSNWFNMFVFHQNRGQKGGSNIVFEELFPSFLDLVVWGHEHECKIVLQGSKPYITQPGSSIATSLIEGEAVPKHVAILELFREQFKWTPIRLRTVRPFVMKHIRLEEEKNLENANKDQLEDFLVKLE